MYVRPFEYLAATSVEEACGYLRSHGPDCKVLAGGQSLMPMVNIGLAEFEYLLDINPVTGCSDVAVSDGSIRIGALATQNSVERHSAIREHHPILAQAISNVGFPRVRNRGTIGGSIAHSDPTAEIPLAMAVLEASYEVSNGRESRRIPAETFPISYFTTALADDEMLVAIDLPIESGWSSAFHEVSYRAGDFAVVGAAGLVRLQGGSVEAARVGLAGVGDKPVRCRTFEEALRGVERKDVPERLGGLVDSIDEEIEPSDDEYVSADYRRRLARVLATRVVTDAVSAPSAQPGGATGKE